MAKPYPIQDREEAVYYFNHSQLAERLQECTQILIDSHADSPRDMLGTPDALKLRSSMTLFESASNAPTALFTTALDRFFDSRCERTLVRLSKA